MKRIKITITITKTIRHIQFLHQIECVKIGRGLSRYPTDHSSIVAIFNALHPVVWAIPHRWTTRLATSIRLTESSEIRVALLQ